MTIQFLAGLIVLFAASGIAQQSANYVEDDVLVIDFNQAISSLYGPRNDPVEQKAQCVTFLNATMANLLSPGAQNSSIGGAVQNTLTKSIDDIMGQCKGANITTAQSYNIQV